MEASGEGGQVPILALSPEAKPRLLKSVPGQLISPVTLRAIFQAHRLTGPCRQSPVRMGNPAGRFKQRLFVLHQRGDASFETYLARMDFSERKKLALQGLYQRNLQSIELHGPRNVTP